MPLSARVSVKVSALHYASGSGSVDLVVALLEALCDLASSLLTFFSQNRFMATSGQIASLKIWFVCVSLTRI